VTSSAFYVVRSATACRRWLLLRLAGAAAVVALIGGVAIGSVRTPDRPTVERAEVATGVLGGPVFAAAVRQAKG
jgi:hypothetical protein